MKRYEWVALVLFISGALLMSLSIFNFADSENLKDKAFIVGFMLCLAPSFGFFFLKSSELRRENQNPVE